MLTSVQICSALYTQSGNHSAGHAVIAFIFISSAFYATTWNGILTGYTVECMSYDVRSKLIVTQNFLVQGTITGLNCKRINRCGRSPWTRINDADLIALRCLDLNPVALKNVGWKYYIAIDAIIVSHTARSIFDRCHHCRAFRTRVASLESRLQRILRSRPNKSRHALPKSHEVESSLEKNPLTIALPRSSHSS